MTGWYKFAGHAIALVIGLEECPLCSKRCTRKSLVKKFVMDNNNTWKVISLNGFVPLATTAETKTGMLLME
jgi:hypothetical protein